MFIHYIHYKHTYIHIYAYRYVREHLGQELVGLGKSSIQLIVDYADSGRKYAFVCACEMEWRERERREDARLRGGK